MLLTIILILFVLFALGLLFIVSSSFWGFLVTRVPYVRSNRGDTLRLLSKVPMKPTDVFYDLGSGDGRVVFMAETMYAMRGVGFERTVWTYLHARIKRRIKRSRAEFYRKDFFKQPWSEATVVYCYLYPPLMRSVEDKFLADCKPGAILVSRDFPLPTLRPIEILNFTAPHNAYIYRK